MKTRIFRWLLAIGLWIFCVRQFSILLNSSGGYAGLAPALFGFASFILGMLLVSPEVVRPICGFFADRFIEFIYPSARASKPPLSYLLARRYRDQRRFDESIEEYQKILRYYPRDRTACRELLLAAKEAGDERSFRKYSRLHLRRFHAPFDPGETLPPDAHHS
jgi:tetratricopeptide (TPR) repeat protein